LSIALITGSAGLVGSETAEYFGGLGFDVVGIDNDMREKFFGSAASTVWNRRRLELRLGKRYTHYDLDIRDTSRVTALFARYGRSIDLIVHAAAQPSHDWAASDPATDFGVNATGTINLLEAARAHAPDAVFIFTSTNKVYGETPNRLPLQEQETRWEIDPRHLYAGGIPEQMSIDQTMHSVFGASKVAADVMVQEYGRYFGMNTGTFRGGCLTGPNHSGAALHGFLSYLMKCAHSGELYTVIGYGGKQVRDNLHSADLVTAFYEFFKAPRPGEVYNIGGGRKSNCSVMEAISLCQEIVGREMVLGYSDVARAGDHIWWISDTGKFSEHYPGWRQEYDVPQILASIHAALVDSPQLELTHV
jgi:CDP-paratose 2-epimerase